MSFFLGYVLLRTYAVPAVKVYRVETAELRSYCTLYLH